MSARDDAALCLSGPETTTAVYERHLLRALLAEHNALLARVEGVEVWKNAVLNELAGTAMDAPQDEPPHSILNRIIRWHQDVATDPALNAELCEATLARAERVERDIADLYDAIPTLPITAETADAATDVLTRYCIDFHEILNRRAAIDAARQGA